MGAKDEMLELIEQLRGNYFVSTGMDNVLKSARAMILAGESK